MNFKYYLSGYKKQNDTQSIRLKMETSKKDVQFIDSKISVLKTQWDSKRQLVKRHTFEEKLNNELLALLNDVKFIYYKNIGTTAKRLLFVYRNSKKHDSSSFLDFYQSLIDEMRLKDKIRSANTNQVYLNKLKQFSGYIAFSDLSVQFAFDYEQWMLKRKNKTNTIASNFKCIYATLNKAVKIGLIDTNPFKGYSIVTENVEKESLTIDEIQLVIDLKIHSRHKGMIEAKDLFLFSFYTAGMRFTDVCKLKWSNIVDGNIVYTMNKSKSRAGSRRSIPLNPKSLEILEKYKGKNDTYIFKPLYGFNKKSTEDIEYRIKMRSNVLNKSLKHIDKHCKINKNMSFHVAKHSFTDYLVKKNIGVLMISKLLGHTKLSTTEHYLKDFYHKEESDTMNELFKS